MKALDRVIGGKSRAAKPVNRPPPKTNATLISSAMTVSNRKRGEPVRMASRKPTHGVINGATRMPSSNTV